MDFFTRLSVHVAAMSDVEDGHRLGLVVNLVDDAKSADSDAPAFAPSELLASGWSWNCTQRSDRVPHSLVGLLGE
jgi:hypothetical protein